MFIYAAESATESHMVEWLVFLVSAVLVLVTAGAVFVTWLLVKVTFLDAARFVRPEYRKGGVMTLFRARVSDILIEDDGNGREHYESHTRTVEL